MNEIHKALENLSKRPVPDLTGAVQHAMAALECVANDVCGENGETLGKVVRSILTSSLRQWVRQSANCTDLLPRKVGT
jgi:hypothetical protein